MKKEFEDMAYDFEGEKVLNLWKMLLNYKNNTMLTFGIIIKAMEILTIGANQKDMEIQIQMA